MFRQSDPREIPPGRERENVRKTTAITEKERRKRKFSNLYAHDLAPTSEKMFDISTSMPAKDGNMESSFP